MPSNLHLSITELDLVLDTIRLFTEARADKYTRWGIIQCKACQASDKRRRATADLGMCPACAERMRQLGEKLREIRDAAVLAAMGGEVAEEVVDGEGHCSEVGR